MSPVFRPGPGEVLPSPEPLLPLRDADVADIPLLFAAASESMRQLVIDFNMHGPADSTLMNLLNEGLPGGHELDEVGTHYYNAGLVYAFLIAERKYRAGYGGNIPPLDGDAYQRGAAAVQTARQYARSLPHQELWKRVRSKEARFVGSNSLSLAFARIVPRVRKDLAELGIQSEKDEEALHLGMVEGTIFLGGALRDPWLPEVQEFPYNEGGLNIKPNHRAVEEALNALPGAVQTFNPTTDEEVEAIASQMHIGSDNIMTVDCKYGARFGGRKTRQAMAALVMEQVGPGEFVRSYKTFWVDDGDPIASPSILSRRGVARAGLFGMALGATDLLIWREPDAKALGVMALGALIGWVTGRRSSGQKLRSVRVTGRLSDSETLTA